MLAAEREILLAMAGRDMHEAGAGIGGDEIRQEQRHVMIVAAPAQRMRGDRAGELVALVDVQRVMRGDAGGLEELRQQRQRDEQPVADLRARAFLHAIDAEQRVFDLRARGDRAVARHGPGRRRPDHDRGVLHRPGRDREAHPDRLARVVVVFDLRLGERRLLDRRPHHRAQAAIQRAVQQELADLARDRRFRALVHRRIAMLPVALDAEPAEFLALDAHPFLGIGAAFGAEIEHRHRVLVAAGGAILLLDLPLDRQPVAVPARDVVGVVPRHLPRAVDDVLQDLVERRADMEMPVRIGRAVMQDELLPPRGLRAQRVPQPYPVPARQDTRLLLRQVAAHREARGGQEDGVAIVSVVHRRTHAAWSPPLGEAGRVQVSRRVSAPPGR